jgi:hypothetical protein
MSTNFKKDFSWNLKIKEYVFDRKRKNIFERLNVIKVKCCCCKLFPK